MPVSRYARRSPRRRRRPPNPLEHIGSHGARPGDPRFTLPPRAPGAAPVRGPAPTTGFGQGVLTPGPTPIPPPPVAPPQLPSSLAANIGAATDFGLAQTQYDQAVSQAAQDRQRALADIDVYEPQARRATENQFNAGNTFFSGLHGTAQSDLTRDVANRRESAVTEYQRALSDLGNALAQARANRDRAIAEAAARDMEAFLANPPTEMGPPTRASEEGPVYGLAQPERIPGGRMTPSRRRRRRPRGPNAQFGSM